MVLVRVGGCKGKPREGTQIVNGYPLPNGHGELRR